MNYQFANELIRAVAYNDFSSVRVALEDEPQLLNDRDPLSGNTPLIMACNNGYDPDLIPLRHHELNINIIEHLLSFTTIAVNIQSKTGRTALHAASIVGYPLAVSKLLGGGARTDIACNAGRTALHEAAFHGFYRICEMLLTSDEWVMNARDNNGATALLLAAEEGHKDVVDVLIRHKADVNMEDFMGQTPMAVALRKAHVDMCEALANANAHVGFTDRKLTVEALGNPALLFKNSQCMLHIAAMADNAHLVELICTAVSGKEMLDVQDEHGRTAVYLASEWRKKEALKVLLRYGADANVPDTNGKSPLMVASLIGYHDVCELLLAAGVNVDEVSAEGKTALQYADNEHVVRVIESAKRFAVKYAVAHGEQVGGDALETVSLETLRACAEKIHHSKQSYLLFSLLERDDMMRMVHLMDRLMSVLPLLPQEFITTSLLLEIYSVLLFLSMGLDSKVGMSNAEESAVKSHLESLIHFCLSLRKHGNVASVQ